jgi:Ca-activated chloride channel family protein
MPFRLCSVGLLALALLCACSSAPSPSAPAAATVAPATTARRLPTTTSASPPQAASAPTPASRVAGATAARDASQAQPAVSAPVTCCSTGGNAVPNGKPYDSTFYQSAGTNPFVDTLDDHLSTFGMDVDTASYGIARRYLADGHLPDPESVRVEEFLNAFDYHYPTPPEGSGEDFTLYLEAGQSPFNARNDLVQVGIQARPVSSENRKPASLTFVVDTSGSMSIESRLGTVKRALHLLVDQMRPDDRVALVTFGSSAREVLPPTAGSNKQRILQAVDALATDGSTSIEAGLDKGFDSAEHAYSADHINMVLLCTDGVANNGVSDAEGLLRKYRSHLDRGIQLSVFGFGMGNYNDAMLEKLGDRGNGSYAYIDSIDAARRVFVERLTGTLQTVGRDAKIQVDFNPDVVERYRLLGYEDRHVADKDFRNDKVDGGEVGAGQSVTALYEVTRKAGAGAGPAATVHIRYQLPDRSRALEQAATLSSSALGRPSDAPGSARFALARAVAEYAEILKHTYWSRGLTLHAFVPAALSRLESNTDPTVKELSSLMQKAMSLEPAEAR